MLQNLSKEIRECYACAERSKRLADAALTESAKADYLAMEGRWLSLARSYEFAECYRISPGRSGTSTDRKDRPPQLAAP
jgi:hypothetical protein